MLASETDETNSSVFKYILAKEYNLNVGECSLNTTFRFVFLIYS